MGSVSEQMDTTNRPDEWRIENGLEGHKLPILDQSGPEVVHIYPPLPQERVKDEEAIAAVGDRDELFKREKEGWRG
jgi:sulfite oxidase